MAYPEVVRVFATTQDPDHDSPWQTRSPSSSTGSGVVIAGGAILTGAHVVANATFLPPEGVNVYDLLRHDHLVLTQDAAKAIEARCLRP